MLLVNLWVYLQSWLTWLCVPRLELLGVLHKLRLPQFHVALCSLGPIMGTFFVSTQCWFQQSCFRFFNWIHLEFNVEKRCFHFEVKTSTFFVLEEFQNQCLFSKINPLFWNLLTWQLRYSLQSATNLIDEFNWWWTQ